MVRSTGSIGSRPTCRCGSCSGAPQARGVEVRVVRRLSAEPARLRGRATRRGRGDRHRVLPRGDAARIRDIRERSATLVTIGACATAGGIQALRNFRDHAAMMAVVYARPNYIETLATSTAIAQHVKVDFELRGCPIDKRQLLEVVSAYLHGRKPNVQSHSTCVECKMRGTVCVMVAKGQPCLGPVTHAGCGALCPTYARGCYGCFGPSDAPRTQPLADRLIALGSTRTEVERLFSTFNVATPAFREGAAHSRGDGHD